MDRVRVARELVCLARELSGGASRQAVRSRKAIDLSKDLTLEEMEDNSRQFTRDIEAAGWTEEGIGFYFNSKYPTIFVDLNGLQGQVFSNVEENDLEHEFVDDYRDLLKWLKSDAYRKHLRVIKTVHDLEALESRGWRKVEDRQIDYYVNPKYPGAVLCDLSSLGYFTIVPEVGGIGRDALGKAKTVAQAEKLAIKISQGIKEDDEPYIESFLEAVKLLKKQFSGYRDIFVGTRLEQVPRGISFKMTNFGDLSTGAGKAEFEVTITKPKRGPWGVSLEGYNNGPSEGPYKYTRVRKRAKGRGDFVPAPSVVARTVLDLAKKGGFRQ